MAEFFTDARVSVSLWNRKQCSMLLSLQAQLGNLGGNQTSKVKKARFC